MTQVCSTELGCPFFEALRVASSFRGWVRGCWGSLRRSDFSPKSVEDAKYLLKVGWTGRGQTQQLQLAALIVARTQHAEVDLIADEVCELLVGCPGFYDHCGHVEEILRKERPGHSACKKAAFCAPCYEGSWKEAANKKRSEDAS